MCLGRCCEGTVLQLPYHGCKQVCYCCSALSKYLGRMPLATGAGIAEWAITVGSRIIRKDEGVRVILLALFLS